MKNGKTNAFISQNAILKAFGHKYIRRIPKKSGKGFWYIYKETFKKPFQALAQIFGIRKKTISENYKAQNIERDYGASQTAYAAHVLEYFTNREKWDALFAKEENRKKYRKPQKPKAKTGGARKPGAGKKRTSGGREKKPADDAIRVNRSLMYNIWKTYGSGKEGAGAKSGERSRAMGGNDNARKDGANKPQTDDEMRQEKAETEKAREKAGLPPVREDLGQRVSLIDDLTRKEDEDKASRKEAALSRIREAGKNKERLRETDIDWEAIEDGSGAAREAITKANIFGQVDWAGLKASGMAGGAAYLIDKVYEAIADAPQEDTAEARRAYVIGVNALRDWLEDSVCKTTGDVKNVLTAVRDQLAGDYYNPMAKARAEVDLAKTDEYKEREAKVAEIEKLKNEAWDRDRGVQRRMREERQAASERFAAIVAPFLIKNGLIKSKEDISVYTTDLQYYMNVLEPNKKAEFGRIAEIAEKEREEWRAKEKELDAQWREIREEEGRLDSRRDTERKEFKEWVEQALKEAMQEKAMSSNPLAKSWKELGEKIAAIADGKDKWFFSHIEDARRGEHDDWEWAQKYRIYETPKKARRTAFDREVAEEYERKGGRDISAKSTTEIAQMFNLRRIRYHKKVDLKTGLWHARRCAEALADLADVTGIPDSLVSLNGRVALAIGIVEKKTALAYYSADSREICLDKMKSRGTLAHEWFHAFDNLIASAMGGGSLDYRGFMSMRSGFNSKEGRAALKKYLDAKDEASRKAAREECLARDVVLPETSEEEHQMKVASAFNDLISAMKDGDAVLPTIISYTEHDEEEAGKWIREDAEGIGGDIYRADDFDAAAKIIREKCAGWSDRMTWWKRAAAYFGEWSFANGLAAEVDSGSRGSAFLRDARVLDGEKTGSYWSSSLEMAARAFDAYVHDKLREQGRRNNYLTGFHEGKGAAGANPLPQGEERDRINAAFDKLFRVIAETNAIRKALDAVARRNRWIWVDASGKIWVRKSVLKAWKKAMAEQRG